MLFIAVRKGIHVGVVEQRVVAVPPRELLREETSVRKTSQNRLRLSISPCRTRRDHRQRQGLNKCEATNTLVLLVAIREGIDVAVVEEGVVAISPGELLYKGPGFNDKRYVELWTEIILVIVGLTSAEGKQASW